MLNRFALILILTVIVVVILSTPDFPAFIFYSFTVSGVLAAFFRNYFEHSHFEYNRQWVTWASLLLLMPPIYAFGTNSGLWIGARSATYFSLLAALIIFVMHFSTKHRIFILRSLSFILLLYTANYLMISANTPYRQSAALWDMKVKVKFNNGTSLNMEPSFARYTNKYLQLANENGFKNGDGIIDLSGRSPTIAFILNGVNLGTPWMNGWYSGGTVSAARALDFVSCNSLQNAWLITEPGGPRTLPISEFGRHKCILKIMT